MKPRRNEKAQAHIRLSSHRKKSPNLHNDLSSGVKTLGDFWGYFSGKEVLGMRRDVRGMHSDMIFFLPITFS
jgi:hypothetical protein